MELCKLISTFSVSSVLNRDVKQFGKKFLFDGKTDTCWNSDQGDYQHITVNFVATVEICAISIQFQGGFSCKQCHIVDVNSSSTDTFYPEDINKSQYFELPKNITTKSVRLDFIDMNDLFGRVVVYDLKFYSDVINKI